MGGKCREQGAEGKCGGQGRRETQPKGLFFLFFFLRATAEIKGDIFTATEIENHWTHGGR